LDSAADTDPAVTQNAAATLIGAVTPENSAVAAAPTEPAVAQIAGAMTPGPAGASAVHTSASAAGSVDPFGEVNTPPAGKRQIMINHSLSGASRVIALSADALRDGRINEQNAVAITDCADDYLRLDAVKAAWSKRTGARL